MTIRKLERSTWKGYFDNVSRHLPRVGIDIFVEGVHLGTQVPMGDRLSLLGFSYDPGEKVLEVATEKLKHRIDNPTEVFVEDAKEGLRAVRIIGSDGREQVVRIADAGFIPIA